jgi:RimJ/RimL family protein N-acetyltransferase
MFRLAPMTESRARETAGWRYDGDAAIYDHPDWRTMVAQGWGLTDAATREREFVALVDLEDRVGGFLRFMEREGRVDVGIGLRPDLCGRGLGAQAMALLEEEALRRRGPGLLRLEVRSFNERAIRCYEKAGWSHVKVFQGITALGPGEFARMERAVGT